MKVLLLGSLGNMGKRYQSILDHLNVSYLALDADWKSQLLPGDFFDCRKIIIATPTGTHVDIIRKLIALKPEQVRFPDILCEKPISKSVSETMQIFDLAKQFEVNLYMVNQYCFLPCASQFKEMRAHSKYNYFNSGKDGIHWDCIQVYGLANGSISVANNSPKWDCQINGHRLNIRDMDKAYIKMVKSFLADKEGLWGEVETLIATRKVLMALHE